MYLHFFQCRADKAFRLLAYGQAGHPRRRHQHHGSHFCAGHGSSGLGSSPHAGSRRENRIRMRRARKGAPPRGAGISTLPCLASLAPQCRENTWRTVYTTPKATFHSAFTSRSERRERGEAPHVRQRAGTGRAG